MFFFSDFSRIISYFFFNFLFFVFSCNPFFYKEKRHVHLTIGNRFKKKEVEWKSVHSSWIADGYFIRRQQTREHDCTAQQKKNRHYKTKPTVDRTRHEIFTARASCTALSATANATRAALQMQNIRFLFVLFFNF